MTIMANNLDAMRLAVTKENMTREMAVAEVEGKVAALLPIDCLDEAAMYLLENRLTAKAIAVFILNSLDVKGFKDPDLTDIVIGATKLVFTPKLCAFMFLDTGNVK